MVCDDVLGACSDGTIYSFSILSEQAIALLKFIENLIQAREVRDPAEKFCTTKLSGSAGVMKMLMDGVENNTQVDVIQVREVDPGEGKYVPKKVWVDGDRILGYFGGVEAMEDGKAVMELVRSDGMERGVEGLFWRIVGELGLRGDTEKEGVRMVGEWIGAVLGRLL